MSGRSAAPRALPPGADPAERAGAVRRAHQDFLRLGTIGLPVRNVVAESWRRCAGARVEPDGPARVDLTADDLAARRAEHPLAGVMPLIRDILGTVAQDGAHLLSVGDETGRMLWVEGHAQVRRRVERMNFVPGSRWANRAPAPTPRAPHSRSTTRSRSSPPSTTATLSSAGRAPPPRVPPRPDVPPRPSSRCVEAGPAGARRTRPTLRGDAHERRAGGTHPGGSGPAARTHRQTRPADVPPVGRVLRWQCPDVLCAGGVPDRVLRRPAGGTARARGRRPGAVLDLGEPVRTLAAHRPHRRRGAGARQPASPSKRPRACAS